MNAYRFQDIWLEQCRAAGDIRERHGVKAAFDYLVGEKLMVFAEAAVTRPEFAREMPRFLARVRELFSPDEIKDHLARLETAASGSRRKDNARTQEQPAWFGTQQAAHEARYSQLRDLLLADRLGTS